jgi:enoyl-CoA hydratase/carnithine racemase
LFEGFHDQDHWPAALEALVHDVLALSPLALQATKRSIVELSLGQGSDARMRERANQSALSEDFAEGRAAFAQRRKPVFKPHGS